MFIRSSYEKNKIILFGEGEEKRSHIYIDDLMEIVLRIIKSKAFGFINLASTPVSFEKADTQDMPLTKKRKLDLSSKSLVHIHGIQKELIQDAPTFLEVKDHLIKILKSYESETG